MKAAIAAGVGVFLALFVLTTFVPSPEARALAEAYRFKPEEIDDGLQYAFQRRLLFWASTFVWLGFLTWLVFSGGGRKLADRCTLRTGGHWLPAVLLVGAVLFLAQTALSLPFSLASLELARAWGMTSQPVWDWARDFGLALVVNAVTGAVVLVLFYLAVYLMPRWWWAPAAGVAGALGVVYALILPLVIEPLFNDFRPLEDGKLRQRVQALAARAGVEVDEVYVVDASRRSNHTNAYFTGFGPTRRIVLYDTLIKKHKPDEIESVLGHEIGHWRHDHIVKGILLATAGALVGFFILSRVLLWAVGRRPFHLNSPDDPAGLPLVLLLIALGSWLARPAENSVSRHFERQADAAALELAGKPEVFIDTERRMARDNISNVAPAPWSVWLFNSHPPVIERIQMAEGWQKR
jgi:STE24 endopeptidase